MNETEDLVRQTLRMFGDRSPNVHGLAEGAKERARAGRRKNAAAVGGVLVAVIAVGVVWVVSPHSTSPPPGSDPANGVDITQLTGADVGEALGLEPISGTVYGCNNLTEYVNGTGFCLEGVTDNEFEEDLLSEQIRGHPRTPALQQYVVLVYEYRRVLHNASHSLDLWDLVQRAEVSLGQEVEAEQKARESNPDSPVDTTARALDSGTRPSVDVTYAYTLDTFCGIEWIRLDGDAWRAAVPSGGGSPDRWGNPQVGLLRLVSENEALYTDELGHLVFFVREPDATPLACE
jgi:hypothetical protein